MKIIAQIETTTSIITLNEDGIGHIHFKDFSHCDMPEEEENIMACIRITNNQTTPFVITSGEHVIFTKQVRENSKKINPVFSATALVANNLAYRLIAKFYIIMRKPTIPFKIFTDAEKAFEWCKQFVDRTHGPL